MKNKTFRIITLMTGALLLLGSCAKKESFDLSPEFISLEQILFVLPDCDNPVSVDLVAGQHFTIGSVTAERIGDVVLVSYNIQDPLWSISEIHLATGEIPVNKKNNPMVGRFAINEEYESPIKSKSFEIELDWNGPFIPIAAHAVVQKNLALETFNESLPDEHLDFVVSHPGGESYFGTTVIFGGTSETFDGWCIDTDNGISSNIIYSAELVSTYELAGMGLVEFPENLDKVNWLLNQDLVGMPSACGGDYTYGDIQRSIWGLIEDYQSTSGLGPWEQCRVDEILAAALEYGHGFEPACEQEIAVALVPYDAQGNPISRQITITQITIIEKLLECEQEYLEETAWGEGMEFNQNNWATKFYICNR